ncbi:type II toxin-antitoxin system RelE/ParE family toxin [Psychromonas antarctica]|uniref:type II toxin-antitoxin system RelE/ParE family toxin n=1 Tax=Psychromonas antarctica TaxID=67573 RepID=UPI001EE8B794|nr:type II toxin-antitoxin system RelE/ParE family toxin [Psychromonas antarctica]MCG6199914.1 type II toxin-antitoxin system RelE/ParE family toxin [Psychromonas antarctica]
MAEIIWTKPALEDLNDIAEYIALSNLLSANKLVKIIFEKVERLEAFPESGKKPFELNNLNYREIIVNPCRLFYKIENGNVFILHIMRQERDLRKFLLLI